MSTPKVSRRTTHSIELSPDDITEAIKEWCAKHFYLAAQTVTLNYAEVGGDPMDRFPGTRQVVSATATTTVATARPTSPSEA